MTVYDLDHIRLCDNIDVPDGIDVRVTDDPIELMRFEPQLNNATTQLFGTAYRQGGRLHFATAMPVRDYIMMTRVDQAPRGSTMDELNQAFNRPKEKAHGKAIEKYLGETACQGLPFIFPAFLVNYGVGWTEDMPKASLTIFCGAREAMVWPAIFEPPTGEKLPVTDGGHRTDAMATVLNMAAAGRLPENGLSVIFVMEDDINAYHQDFSDCAKAKAIANSISSTWDRREASNRFGGDLVKINGYLARLVDASSNSVNLSSNSAKAWSMSAVHSAITGVYAGEQDPKRLSGYIDALFTKVPILVDVANGGAPAKHRNLVNRGGCVLLRGVGFAVLLQGYIHALRNGMALDDMADKMASLDWYALKPDAKPPQNDELASAYVEHAAQYIWQNMLAMMANATTFRIKGTKDAATESFKRIRKELAF